jgi:hypothetical protein
MLRLLAIVPALVLALSASSSAVAGIQCLNSKPCGSVCIAWHKVCHLPPRCRHGYYRCGKGCIPNRDLCAVR